MQQNKKFILVFFFTLFSLLLCFAFAIYWLDPYFHYHGVSKNSSYFLTNERYQNNGITRNFSYNAMITGTSMTENFKTSELDNLFCVNSIKVPYSGASFKEINDSITLAISYNKDLSFVFRGLDLYNINVEKDFMAYSDYPSYLYDENPFNDISYLWNKDIFFGDAMKLSYLPTKLNLVSTTFDEYSNWNDSFVFGEESVLCNYIRADKNAQERVLSDSDKINIFENISQNLLTVAQKNPDITFYYFYMPYSIVYFDSLHQSNETRYFLDSLSYATSLLVEQENIYLFSFLDDYEIITNLDNYKDPTHYSEDINSYMLSQMALGERRLTTENYETYFEAITDFYLCYDYDSLF